MSIITPTRNAANVIQDCLDSVTLQDYPRVEHIVIDAASTDGTVQILQEKARAGCWISEPDEGLFFGWNKGLAKAKGDWIAFLGADDRYLPGAISSYMRLAERNPDAAYLSSRVRWIGPNGSTRIIGKPWRWPEFQRYMCTAHVGSMQSRHLFEQYGLYDTTLRIVADYELLLRAKHALHAAFMQDITADMRGGGNSDRPKALTEAAYVKWKVGLRSAPVVACEWLLANLGHQLRKLI